MTVVTPDTITPRGIAESYVPKEIPLPAGLTPEEQAVRKLGREKREIFERTKDTDPTAALKRVEGVRDLSQIDIAREVDRRIGTPETTELTDEQKTLRKTVSDSAAEARTIAERGLDGIVDVAGNPDTTRQQAIVDTLVKTVLDVRPKFAGLSKEEKQAIIRDLLQAPAARTEIASSLGELLDPNADTAESITPINVAHETYETARKAVKSAKKEIKSTTDEVDILEKTANEHAATNPVTGLPGTKFQQIETLRGSIDYARMTSLRESLQKAYGENFERAQQLVREKLKNGSSLATGYEKELGELVEMTDKAKGLEELIAERDGLPDKLAQKQKSLKKLRKEKAERKAKRNDAEEEFDEAEEIKSRQEQALARSVESAVSDSLNEFLDADIDVRIKLDKEISAEKIQQARDADERRILTGIDSRWDEVEETNGIRGKKIRLKNRVSRIKYDWTETLTDGRAGIESKVRAMAKAEFAPSPTDTPEEILRKQAERDRIDRRFAEEPEFADKMTREYVARLIAKQRQIGKITEDELRLLDKHGLRDAIDTAIAEDPRIDKSQIAELVGESNDPSAVENAKRKYGDGWAKIIMGLLAAGAAASSFARA